MRAKRRRDAHVASFSGEVWTDARGYATVALPRASARPDACLEYELRPLTPGVSACVAAELSDGRFTIATDEPHVKVAWRITGRPARSDAQPLELPREES